jgi:putative transposase
VSHCSVRVHFVWGTKERREAIPAEMQARLWGYMGATATKLGMKVFAVGGMEDHCHLLVGLPSTMAVAEAAQKIKANSSRWMREQGRRLFAWQEGYGAFSVSISHMDATIAYVRNQAEHHRRRTFDEELDAMLQKHGLERAVPAGLGS